MAQAAPVIFVLLWSTGFIGAKLGLPHAEPFTFLTIRMLITLAILAPVALVFVRPLPGMTPLLHSAVTGVLVHGCYLGGVFYAIGHGMPAGVSALVVALQPLLTA
ncbi:MAG: EamA family transporter, partial [Nitratireductor sp.]|nr:EamA family transporter [Nitratireductor sp.]